MVKTTFRRSRPALVAALLLACAAAPAGAATAGDTCAALAQARGHLVSMLGTGDRAALDELRAKVAAASSQVDSLVAAMESGGNPAEAQQAAQFKAVWSQFKNTRESEIIPALYAGKAEQAKALATGIQAERMAGMKAAMGCP